MVVSGLVAARPVLAKGRDRAVNQPRVQRRHRLVAEAERLERSRPVILNHNIGAGHKPLQDLSPGFGLQIERDRALVRSLGQKAGPHARAVQRPIAAGAAGLVGVVRILDFDHIGAKDGELIGGERSGQHMGDVDDANALERSGHMRLLGVEEQMRRA